MAAARRTATIARELGIKALKVAAVTGDDVLDGQLGRGVAARVLSARPTGSVADGTADQWVAAITPTVFARTPLAPFIINTVTAEGLTVVGETWLGWDLPATLIAQSPHR